MAHATHSTPGTHGHAAAATVHASARPASQDATNAGLETGTTISIPEALK